MNIFQNLLSLYFLKLAEGNDLIADVVHCEPRVPFLCIEDGDDVAGKDRVEMCLGPDHVVVRLLKGLPIKRRNGIVELDPAVTVGVDRSVPFALVLRQELSRADVEQEPADFLRVLQLVKGDPGELRRLRWDLDHFECLDRYWPVQERACRQKANDRGNERN